MENLKSETKRALGNLIPFKGKLVLEPVESSHNYHDNEASNKPRATSAILWTMMFGIALLAFVSIMASGLTTFDGIANAFPVDVLVILVTLDLFSLYVVQTGVLDKIGQRLSYATKGRSDLVAIFMGVLMFLSSAILNNLAAIFILAPIFLSLLAAMRAPRQISIVFLSLMLVLCNLGGMATPVGDFPAIMLMSSGIVSFTPYLLGAFPLAASLALVAILAYSHHIQQLQKLYVTENDRGRTRASLELLKVQNKYVAADKIRAAALMVIFALMVVSWAVFSPSAWPFFMTSLTGAAAATLVAGPKHSRQVLQSYDLRTTIVMTLILALAALVSISGVVEALANWLVVIAPDETILLLTLMVVVAMAAGLFSAGPATAAVLPIFITLSNGPLAIYGDWLGIAFAASICAGSSMFMHSATAGPTLHGEALKAKLSDCDGRAIWTPWSYLKFGFFTSVIQLILSMAWILACVHLNAAVVMNLVPLILLLAITKQVFRKEPTDHAALPTPKSNKETQMTEDVQYLESA